jgi:MFS family permease
VVPIILLTMHNYAGLVLVFIARGLCTVQFPARDSILAAHTARTNRATMIGVNQALSQLSQVVVPVAIGVLADRVGVQLPFAIALVLCVAATLIALPLREKPVAETAAAEVVAAETVVAAEPSAAAAATVEPPAGASATRSSLAASIRGMFAGGRALPLTLLLAATMFNGLANGATNIMLPFTIMDRFSSGYTFVNALSAVMSFGSMIVLLFGGRLADLKGRKAIIMFSGVLFPLAMLGILYAGTVWQFGLLLLVVSMLGNVSSPAVSAVYMEAVSEDARATFAGAYMGINAAAMAIGSALSGRIYASNAQLAWYCASACFALWTVCFLFALPARRRAEVPVFNAAE